MREAIISLWRFLNRPMLKQKHVYLTRNVHFNRKTYCEGYNRIYHNTDISSSHIGRGTYISRDCTLKSCKIGRFCSIAPEVRIMIGEHPLKGNISTHPAFFSTKKQAGFTFTDNDTFNEIEYAEDDYIVSIGHDVWIGQGVLIKQGVNIGNGAVIGAASLVLNDIEPFSIYAGVPAKLIRMRINDEDVRFIMDHPWWEMDVDELRKIADNMSDIKTYREIFKER